MHETFDAAAAPRPRVVLARDYPAALVARQARDDAWVRVTRGAYAVRRSTGDQAPAHRRELALARVAGLDDRLEAPHVFSHETAALVWGLPTWRVPDRTHVVHEYHAGTGRDPQVVHHDAPGGRLPRSVIVRGLPVTTLEQTAVDCARSLPPGQALVIVDAALRRGAARAALAKLIASCAGRRGVRRARSLIELGDPGAESAGESMTRFVLLRDGLPAPLTQPTVETRLGTFRSDLGWQPWRLLLEYDGRTKYADDPEAIIREKRRHDAIVEAGWTVLRVTKEDLAGTLLTGRVVKALPADVRPRLAPRRELRA